MLYLVYMVAEKMKRFFTLPNHKNDELNNTARLIYYSAIGLIILSLLFIVAVPFFAPNLIGRTVRIGISIIPTSIGILILVRYNRIWAAGILLTVISWLTITFSAITAGGVSAPIVIGYVVVILLGSLIPKQRTSIIFTIVCIVSILLMAFAEINQILPTPLVYSPIERVSVYAFFFVVVMILQVINSRNSQRLLKQAQNSELRYKSLLENTPTITYINSIDANALTEYVSPQVEKLLGYDSNDFINNPLFWTQILHSEDAEKVLVESQRTSLTQAPFDMEYRIISKDNKKGEPLFWLGVWTDITSRKEAEEQQADLIHVMAKRNIQLQTAAEVSRAASSLLNLNILLPTVVDLIHKHFDYYYVGVFLVEKNRESAVLSAATGDVGNQMIKTGYHLKVEESSMVGWCIRHGEARIALDVGEDAVRFVNPCH